MYKRHITDKLTKAFADTPVIFLNGARQTGKSTLAKAVTAPEWPATYFTLDKVAPLAAIKANPIHFIQEHAGPIIIDEIQKAPELLTVIKETGNYSANFPLKNIFKKA